MKKKNEYWKQFYEWVEQFRDDFDDRPEDWDLFYTNQVEQAQKEFEYF